jgi:probable rRNA maturation factor
LRKVRKDLAAAAQGLGLEASEVSILFTGSAKITSLNREYRGIPKETDVLSFPMGAPARGVTGCARPLPVMLGDIVISIPKAIAQSREYGVTFQDELRRLLIHGLLHLAGYDHERNRYQKRRMQKKEKELLSAVQAMD